MSNNLDTTQYHYQPIDRKAYALLHCGLPWLILLFFAGIFIIMMAYDTNVTEENVESADSPTATIAPFVPEGAAPYDGPLTP